MMTWMRAVWIVTALLATVALPAQAGALTLAPPGKAGVNQYAETIPSSSGNIAPPSGGGSVSPAYLSQLGHGRSGAAKLAKLGSAGQAAAGLAEATAPRPAGRVAAAAAQSPGDLRPGQPKGQSTLAAFWSAVTGSDGGGLGLLFPVLLASGLIMSIAITLGAARRRAQPPDAAR